MGLNFAIYESAKSFSESPFFKFDLKSKLLPNNIGKIGTSSVGVKINKITEPEGALAAVFRKGLCGAIAGGTSKFIVYPLVSKVTSLHYTVCGAPNGNHWDENKLPPHTYFSILSMNFFLQGHYFLSLLSSSIRPLCCFFFLSLYVLRKYCHSFSTVHTHASFSITHISLSHTLSLSYPTPPPPRTGHIKKKNASPSTAEHSTGHRECSSV